MQMRARRNPVRRGGWDQRDHWDEWKGESLVNSTHEMQIGELAQLCQTTTRTLRYYEDLGLIEPVRRLDGGFRVYGSNTVDRIRHIHELTDLLGWPLIEVRRVIEAEDDVEKLRSQYLQSSSTSGRLEVLGQATDIIQAERALVSERMEKLGKMREALDAKLRRYAELSNKISRQEESGGSGSEGDERQE
jgi:DNA-binding transcriptional MerR regulator